MDARQRRSRERLFRAILELARDRSVTDLTVTEVASTAGVHRSTFYEHASSPAGLLEAALVAELDALRDALLADGGPSSSSTVTEVSLDVLRHIEDHADVYRRGLDPRSGPASLHGVLAAHFAETSRQLRERAGARIVLPDPSPDGAGAGGGGVLPADAVDEAAVRFVADGTVGAIVAWLDAPEVGAEDFLALWTRLLPGWWPRALPARGTDGTDDTNGAAEVG